MQFRRIIYKIYAEIHYCTIPKLFPHVEFLAVSMKLNKSKILRILEGKNNGISSYQLRKEAGVSKRRVDQVWSRYLQTDEIPLLKRSGRQTKPIKEADVYLVREAYTKYGVSASTLEKLILQVHGIRIGHNRIHRILLQEGLASSKGEVMPRKKKWIRYERRHSLTAVHVDWHQRPNDGPWVFAVEDDASRALLAIIESNSPTTELSIAGMKTALEYGQIQQCISDHGSQFTSNTGGESKFKEFLDTQEIKQILCRIKHPQSNGKVEKFFHLYERKRDNFATLEEFQRWYNEVRPHLSLHDLETPWQAFQRKMRY